MIFKNLCLGCIGKCTDYECPKYDFKDKIRSGDTAWDMVSSNMILYLITTTSWSVGCLLRVKDVMAAYAKIKSSVSSSN